MVGEFPTFKTQSHSALNYLGMSLTLAWYYCLWFTPNTFPIYLLDDMVTFSWLATLALSGFFFIFLPFALKERRLSGHPVFIAVVFCVLSVATLIYTLFTGVLKNPFTALVLFPLIFGVGNAIVWSVWGEYHARQCSAFTLRKFALTYGVTLLISIAIASALPHGLTNVFTAALPLLDGAVFYGENEATKNNAYPKLLPKAIRQKTDKATLIISMSLFIACAACYYNIAIIPNDALALDSATYALGIVSAAILCIGIAFWERLTKGSTSGYRLLPWLLVACTIAIALFVSKNESIYTFSFIIAVVFAGVFEILAVSYFGALSTSGYIAPAMAFGISGCIARIGFFFGDGLAVIYEHNDFLAASLTTPTSLFFICALAASLIPLLRQESVIVRLSTEPATASEIALACSSIVQEFSLSKRESEVLLYLVKGYTAENISKKLVISVHTTQTHIRHIYTKMNIHKRSELIEYVNQYRENA